jgi:hypothetical protein
MNDCEPATPRDTVPSVLESGKTPGTTAADGPGRVAPTAPHPPASSPAWPLSATMDRQARWPRAPGPLSNVRRGLIVAAALIGSVTGLFVGLGTSSAGAAQSVPATGSHGPLGAGGQGSNARSGPARGGSSGTVGNVAKSNFTLTTSAGQEVTVDEDSSTKYEKGTSASSKSAITKGEHVLVLGTVSSTTIKATQVLVQTTGGGSKPSTAAMVVPFQRGAAETSKQVGQIPASYSQGSGTIVSGATANKATEAALTAYPGGIVDRVVKLSNGEYEVHNIGVNWPHHIFVNRDFKVVGAA